ncbi:hypothetical protein [Acidovorax sp.]|uniref:hypothetical protein n=1 Tax=Acidovorax sp. TaxID=1872122 RepID=UPI003D02B637
MNSATLIRRGRQEGRGLKHQVHTFLHSAPHASFNLADISDALSLTKLDHPKIASVLSKLDSEGAVQATTGPAPHARGVKQVKYYQARGGSQ